MEETTIANYVTPLIESGTSIIRISGPLSFKIIDKIFYPTNYIRFKKKETYTAHYGDIKINNKTIDEVIVLLMKKPNSFTGEDIVEIQSHGNPFIVKIILKELLKKGCKLSERGEFAKRAFLNGKIDLSQSEAILDLVEANNKNSLNLAISQLKGGLSFKIKTILKMILEIISSLETSIDFPEDEIDNILDKKKLIYKNKNIIKKINLLLDTYSSGKIYKEGIKAILIGTPNVGKSTIFNLLLKEERAIITDIPGTTRDILEEKIILNNITINLIDTAGIHFPKDKIEKIGISKTYSALENSQLIFFVTDNTKYITNEEKKLLNKIKKQNKHYIIIENKIDLQIKKNITRKFKNSILFSAKKNIGIKSLETKINKILNIKTIKDNVLLTNLRYYELLTKSLIFLNNALNSFRDDISYDLISIDFRSAYEILGKITGDTIEENLLNTIFSKFCIGK